MVTLTGLTMQNGSAFYGGGIYNLGTLRVSNSTLSGNSAGWYGGGIWNNGTLTVTPSTLEANHALGTNPQGKGGGIFNYGTAAVTHSTFFSNSAYVDGGGIQNWNTLTAKNSIISNSAHGGDCGAGVVTSLGYNIDSDNTCNLTQLTDQPDTDPQLGLLQDNGGPTCTHALLQGSPALDAGSCSAATADQRGFPRPVDLLTIPDEDDGCDIGAHEFQDVAISGLSASNDGPTVLGQPTAFAAAVTAGTNVSYAWDFGDGGSGTGPNPSHTYSAIGPYTATVTATNTVGSANATTAVTIVDETIGGLSAGNDGPTVLGQPTAFAATVTAGTNVSYAWDFGDGGSGGGPTPSHTYAAVGPYMAMVTATNSVGSATATTAVTVSVEVYLPIIMRK